MAPAWKRLEIRSGAGANCVTFILSTNLVSACSDGRKKEAQLLIIGDRRYNRAFTETQYKPSIDFYESGAILFWPQYGKSSTTKRLIKKSRTEGYNYSLTLLLISTSEARPCSDWIPRSEHLANLLHK